MVKTIMAVKLEKEDYEFLKQYCEGNGVEVSTFVRGIIALHVKELRRLKEINIPLSNLALAFAHYGAVAEDHRFTFAILRRILLKLGDSEGVAMTAKAIEAIEKERSKIMNATKYFMELAGLKAEEESYFHAKKP